MIGRLFGSVGMVLVASGSVVADDRCVAMAPVIQQLSDLASEFDEASSDLIDQLPEIMFDRGTRWGADEVDLPRDAQRAFHDFEDEAYALFEFNMPDYLSRSRMLSRELEACSES